jgi:hypothetical protein
LVHVAILVVEIGITWSIPIFVVNDLVGSFVFINFEIGGREVDEAVFAETRFIKVLYCDFESVTVKLVGDVII